MSKPTGPSNKGRTRRPNFNQLYSSPLPVDVRPLPQIIPHNPLSIIYYLYEYFFPAVPTKLSIHASFIHDGTVIRVVDDAQAQKLWKMGFFGKGSLSRSEPSWHIRTARRLGLALEEGVIAPEEITQLRREERKKFKEERAKVEQLELERRKMIDRGEVVATEIERAIRPDEVVVISNYVESVSTAGNNSDTLLTTIRTEDDTILTSDGLLISQEHFQLMPVETFFLNYSLNVLTVSENNKDLTSTDLFNRLLVNQDSFQLDDKFILEYVVYHHYRSLGWCVRGGVKFGVDFMLYKRGPPFSHAEFAVLVMPFYNDEAKDNALRKDWWWNTNVSRIIGGVKKTLVFCYVEIPSNVTAFNNENSLDVTSLLTNYKVREIVYRRWIPSRNRD